MPFRPRAVLPMLLLLAGTLFMSAGLVSAAFVSRASGAEFTDAAGRRVVLPARIGRILPAERNAEVLIYVLAPDKLAGIEALPRGSARLAAGRGLVLPLRWRPRSTPDSMAGTAQQVGADLIIDAGPVTPENAAYADAVQRLAGIPYILVDSSFQRTPAVLSAISAMLGVGERGDELRLFAEHAITGLRGRLLIRPAGTRPHVYYGMGADGLTTALPGSPAGATLEEAGAINVASSLGRNYRVAVDRDQLIAWDPEIIIAERRSFYNALRRDRGWRRLSAVRSNKVYLEPTMPFGWIEDPSGVNRLMGLYWLSTLFYPDATQEDLRGTTCEFYDKFYRMRLTNAQIEALVGPAGVPPPDVPRLGDGMGLGLPQPTAPTPPPAMPPGLPGAAPSPLALPSTPLPPAADQRNAQCTIPGLATPIGGIIGNAPVPPVPGVRRQPRAGLPGGEMLGTLGAAGAPANLLQ